MESKTKYKFTCLNCPTEIIERTAIPLYMRDERYDKCPNCDGDMRREPIQTLNSKGILECETIRATIAPKDVPLLQIELDNINSIPRVFYKGEEIVNKMVVSFDWATDKDNTSLPTYIKIQHGETTDLINTKTIQHNEPSDIVTIYDDEGVIVERI